MRDPLDHCQCDNCSGRDCGQDNPERYLAQKIADKEAHDTAIRNATLDELKWMKPICFGNHEAICDTRCAWVVRQRCTQSLRAKEQAP